MSTDERRRGRSRDPDIDARVLLVAARYLATQGYEAMSLTAIAQEARTTRQALYRRWPTKAALAADAAFHAAEETTPTRATQHPSSDLVAELASFQRGITRPGRLSLVGTMLQDTTVAEVRIRYQAQVVAPRRARLRGILERAQGLGLIDADADLDVAVTMCTGSWYSRALAGSDVPLDWPSRTAALVWRSVGGTSATEREQRPPQPRPAE